MTWFSRVLTVTGLVLLAHAYVYSGNYSTRILIEHCSCYSAQEHAALSATMAKHVLSQQSGTSLPIDISIETIIATFIVCFGLVCGAQPLRPIQWNIWAGKLEREGGKGFLDASGAIDKDYRGSPYANFETRSGFLNIRKQRKEFAQWAKAQGQ